MEEKLNKFELTVILSARARELAAGAKPKVDVSEFDMSGVVDFSAIAKKELDEGVLDLEIYKKDLNK